MAFLNVSVIVVIEPDLEFQVLPFLPHNREKIVLLNLTPHFNYNMINISSTDSIRKHVDDFTAGC